MIIDAHTHIFSPEMIAARQNLCKQDRRFNECYNQPKARMKTAPELIESMDQAGVDRAIVTGYAFENGQFCATSNDYISQAVREYPNRLIGLGAVQPLDGDKAVYETERCFAAGLKGLGELLPDGQGFDLTDTRITQDIVTIVEQKQGLLMVHASDPLGKNYPGKGQTTPDKILRLAESFGNCTIIAAHWGGGLPFYELKPEIATSLTNLYYDTAATTLLYRFEVFRAVTDITGVNKILWASDWPLLGQAHLLQRIREEGNLNLPELTQVLGGNAARLMKL